MVLVFMRDLVKKDNPSPNTSRYLRSFAMSVGTGSLIHIVVSEAGANTGDISRIVWGLALGSVVAAAALQARDIAKFPDPQSSLLEYVAYVAPIFAGNLLGYMATHILRNN